MNLYRRSTLQASFVLLLAGIGGITTAVAQRHKPHQLRATAVLEFVHDPGGTTTRLVPVTILVDGSLHDASIYKAAPEPMALDSGVVYEAQKTGEVMGYFTINKATKTADFWTAQGRWELPRAPKVEASAASSSGASAKSSDERPKLHRAGSAENAPATASPTPTPEVSSAPSDGRPVIRRPSTDGSTQSTPTPTATPSSSPEPAAAAEPEPDDPNRPTLRHRKPGSAQETENAPPPAKPAQPVATPVATAKSPTPVAGGASPTQTLVAVSDAQASDTRSYQFIWKPGEQEAMEKKMRRLALSQLPQENAPGAFNGALTTLANVAIRGFDLDLSNEPVMVLTAEIPPGNAPAAAKPTTRTGTKATTGARSSSSSAAAAGAAAPRVTRYLTLIARVDIDGNPQKLAASMTDSSRLDVAPRLELIDAVDVDGDGLAELLFREYSFDDKSFVVFSIGRTTVTKLFEGASEPLK